MANVTAATHPRVGSLAMAEKFNPAPKDKHAEDPKQAQKSD
jgi:hypothetical protein